MLNVLSSLSPNPAQPQPSPTQIPISSKGTGADTKILGHPTTTPPHPQLFILCYPQNNQSRLSHGHPGPVNDTMAMIVIWVKN